MRILDAGGGNSRHGMAFAGQGHTVTVVDFSDEMLADGRRSAEAAGLGERIGFVKADLATIPALFPEESFDLALCHNVIQYVADVPATLRAIGAALKPGGLLSLVTTNRYAEVYKAAIREVDLAKASALLAGARPRATLFGVALQPRTEDEVTAAMAAGGFEVIERYGVRCLCDWLPNEPKFDAGFMEELVRLELEVATVYPYYLLARYWHVIGRWKGAG